MHVTSNRRSIKNFFLKRSLQYSIIIKILFVVLVTSVCTTTLLGFVYQKQSKKGTFYYMSNDIMQDLELKNILSLTLPAVISAQIATLIITIGIGMFSSRKIAVPLYKIEKWILDIRKGKFKTVLQFRENHENVELTTQCNELTKQLRAFFSCIDISVMKIIKDPSPKSPLVITEISKIKSLLQQIDYK